MVGVAPSLPGLANSVNTTVDPGVGGHPYQFGWLLGFSAASVVYLGLTWAWKPRETFIERAIRPDEVYAERGVIDGRDEERVLGVEGSEGSEEYAKEKEVGA